MLPTSSTALLSISVLLLTTFARALPTPPTSHLVDPESVETAKTLYLTSNNEFIHITNADPLAADRPAVTEVIQKLQAYKYPDTSTRNLIYVEPVQSRVDLRKRQEEDEKWFGRPVFDVDSVERVEKRSFKGDMLEKLVSKHRGEVGKRQVDEEEVEWFGKPVFDAESVERIAKRVVVDKDIGKRALEVNHEGEEDDDFFALDSKTKRYLETSHQASESDALEVKKAGRGRALEVPHDGEEDDDFFALGRKQS
ncbi:hypothetical protein BJ508DRAFT_376243 [Ascobolus immersus RN42]|uniref:Uncharacterized protein n=1 Tax=Ascobolus immersus RN42 TaxID=1160509 RepID=A0A3N4I6G2_ASCIM|nr:hypothetical protein BJ508DRAFT_376243 [Ascobolus immersus RN42]